MLHTSTSRVHVRVPSRRHLAPRRTTSLVSWSLPLGMAVILVTVGHVVASAATVLRVAGYLLGPDVPSVRARLLAGRVPVRRLRRPAHRRDGSAVRYLHGIGGGRNTVGGGRVVGHG